MKLAVIFAVLSCLAFTQAVSTNKLRPALALGDQCGTCKSVTELLKLAIEAGVHEDQIRAGADFICSLFPDQSLANICKTSLEKVLEFMLAEIKKETPENVCKALGMC